MINDREFLYGAALYRLINNGEKTTITHLSRLHPSIYLVETGRSKSAVIFKISKKPTSAWSFTLSAEEESALDTLPCQYPRVAVFLALVCHKDGICCIAKERLWGIINADEGISGQHISVSRQPRSSYYVRGPGRQPLEQTVPQSDWPRVILSDSENSHERDSY